MKLILLPGPHIAGFGAGDAEAGGTDREGVLRRILRMDADTTLERRP